MAFELNNLAHFRDLPEPPILRRVLQSIEMIDSMLSYDFGEAVLYFTEKWSAKESVAVAKNGQGEDLFIVFDRHGCFIKGFAHEVTMATDSEMRARVRSLVPEVYRRHFKEPAFECEYATVFAWRGNQDSAWQATTDALPGVEDGSSQLLSFIKLTPEGYRDWATENYETDVSLEVVTSVYSHVPLTAEMIRALKADLKPGIIRQRAAKIGYPLG